LAGGGAFRQPLLLEAALIPLHPFGAAVSPQPLRPQFRQGIERVPHRFAHGLQPVEEAHRRQHVGGVGALLAARVQQARLLEALQQDLEQQQFGRARQQPGAELREHGVVEPGVGQVQAQEILPVQARAHRVRRLAVGEVLGVLEDRDQGEAPGRFGRLAARWEEGGKLRVFKQDLQGIAHEQVGVPLREGAASDARGLGGDGGHGLGMQAHGTPPSGRSRFSEKDSRSPPSHLLHSPPVSSPPAKP